MTPLWSQVKDALAERIARGELERGGALPTEQELCQQFGVSRITVRRALHELRAEGVLVAGRGRTWRPVGTGDGPQLGVFHATTARDSAALPLDFETLAFEVTTPRRADSKPALHMVRLTRIDGIPVDLVRTWIMGPHATAINQTELEAVPPARLLAQKGAELGRAEQHASAQLATDEDAPLDIDVGDPVLVVDRTVFAGGEPILRTSHRSPGHLVTIEVAFPTTNTSEIAPVRFIRPR
jgi:DNA-binding GntR family transcriptional regulator